MPRKANKKCLNCSKLTAAEAEIQSCWDDSLCPHRRSYYRKRHDKNARRRAARAQLRGDTPENIEVPLPAPAIAMLYLYRQDREAPLHAVAVSVWRGNTKLAVVKPIHCIGMSQGQIREYLSQVLIRLKARYGIQKFKDEVYISPADCPLEDCPLKSL